MVIFEKEKENAPFSEIQGEGRREGGMVMQGWCVAGRKMDAGSESLSA